MRLLSFISENRKRILVILVLICTLILITFVFGNKREKVQEPQKELLEVVDDFSNTIENKEDLEKIVEKTENFSITSTTSQDTVDILITADSFSDSIKNNK